MMPRVRRLTKPPSCLVLASPGGPNVEKAAQSGDAARFDLPRPLKARAGCDFSFSGLKTAVRQHAEANQPLDKQTIADLAAGLQEAVAAHLTARSKAAMALMAPGKGGRLVLAGGVAANKVLRARFEALTQEQGWQMLVPPCEILYRQWRDDRSCRGGETGPYWRARSGAGNEAWSPGALAAGRSTARRAPWRR